MWQLTTLMLLLTSINGILGAAKRSSGTIIAVPQDHPLQLKTDPQPDHMNLQLEVHKESLQGTSNKGMGSASEASLTFVVELAGIPQELGLRKDSTPQPKEHVKIVAIQEVPEDEVSISFQPIRKIEPASNNNNRAKESERDKGVVETTENDVPDAVAVRIVGDAPVNEKNLTSGPVDTPTGSKVNAAAPEASSSAASAVASPGTHKSDSSTARPPPQDGSYFSTPIDPVFFNAKTEAPAMDDESVGASTLDPVDEEIKKVLDSLPKLPELLLADNKTRLMFQKDPEEIALDDRITEIARQLAETSLRHQFEEKKLGHYIPIRLRNFDEEDQSQQQSVYSSPPAAAPAASAPAPASSNMQTYQNQYDFYPQQARMMYKPVPVAQHIYNRPSYYFPLDMSSGSSTDAGSRNSYSTQASSTGLTNDAVNRYSSDMDPLSQSQYQYNQRYFYPMSGNIAARNGVPVVFDLVPQDINLQNDLNPFPYRDAP